MKGSNGILAMNISPRCGAKTRPWNGGHPCKCPAMKNGRCRMHGGKSTGPIGRQNALKRGCYTKEVLQMRKVIRKTLTSLRENRDLCEQLSKAHTI